jgi:anaerobic selenocysteine-containing dehydrogenase
LPFAEGGFTTPSGKFEFGVAAFHYQAPAESRYGEKALTSRFPLELVSSKNDDSMNSTFGHRESVDQQTSVIWIHPDDAVTRQIHSGDLVRAFNNRGSSFFTAKITDDTKPGVVRAPSTRWSKTSQCGLGVNRLTSDRLTDIGGGATFYSCLVEVVPAGAQRGVQ